MASQSSVVLLNRLISSKESSPFLLVVDSLTQSSYHLIAEIAYKSKGTIIYLSYETVNKPDYADEFIDCTSLSNGEIVKVVKSKITSKVGGGSGVGGGSRTLIIIDSLNYINNNEITTFIGGISDPSITVVGTFHVDSLQAQANNSYYPNSLSLLSFIASSIFEVEPFHQQYIEEESLSNSIRKLNIPINNGLNSPIFKLTLTNRRKSGRSLIYIYKIDTTSHEYEVYKESQQDEIDPEDESLLKDLTTFNLTTNSKQKLAREQVELPFMEAQEALGSSGGAIVYEFEKDDDYDEEDPYEDPF
ncbi:Elongator complex protein 5 [Scheffersomyces amazonensis]|uniref:Elongator complex protein 5 n=1 Tax=Scheffersomyces amazonensis TaxID=1078765 RepID=UPI00315DC22C